MSEAVVKQMADAYNAVWQSGVEVTIDNVNEVRIGAMSFALRSLRIGQTWTDPATGLGVMVVPVVATEGMVEAAKPPASDWIGHPSPSPGVVDRWRAAFGTVASRSYTAMLASLRAKEGK